VPLDRHLHDLANALGQPVPEREVRHEIERGPDVVRQGDMARERGEAVRIDDRQRILVAVHAAAGERFAQLVDIDRDRLAAKFHKESHSVRRARTMLTNGTTLPAHPHQLKLERERITGPRSHH